MSRRAPWLPIAAALVVSVSATAADGPSDAVPIVLPLTFVDGLALVNARVGETDLRVLVDTAGFGSLGVRPELLPRMDVRYTGGATERTDGGGRTWTGRRFVVPELRVAGARIAGVDGYERREAESGPFGGWGAADAVLGRDFLQRFVVVVDHPHARIELHPRDAGRAVCRGQARTTLFTVHGGFWASEVETDRGSLILVWDTGARDASFVRTEAARNVGLAPAGADYSTRRFAIGTLDLGATTLVALPLQGRLDADGMIGGPVFARHRVCFDAANRNVTLD